ncbi:MAG: hypothetical protein OK436_06505 [Thaumarchaeota archaeon]|nr:hypothetical protein [Nitrososphaerota archaeon]
MLDVVDSFVRAVRSSVKGEFIAIEARLKVLEDKVNRHEELFWVVATRRSDGDTPHLVKTQNGRIFHSQKDAQEFAGSLPEEYGVQVFRWTASPDSHLEKEHS